MCGVAMGAAPNGGAKKSKKISHSSKRFRSSDLWVMGPARFHCATLLNLIDEQILPKNCYIK